MSDNNVELLKQAMVAMNKKSNSEKVDTTIKMKPAKVIGVDEDTQKVFAYFIDDLNQNTYTFNNKSGEALSVGDNVKIFYTTNPAKGWIGVKSGETTQRISNVESLLEPITAITINSNVDYTVSTNAGQERYVGILEG